MRASFYTKEFKDELLRAYSQDLTISQIADYFEIKDDEINEALDVLLPIWEAMGRITADLKEDEEDNG